MTVRPGKHEKSDRTIDVILVTLALASLRDLS